MANKTIVDLTELTAPAGTGVVPLDTGIQTFKVKLSNLTKFAAPEVIVGSHGRCTHATLAAALADAAVVAGMRVLLTENFNIAAKITISKSLHIEAMPGVTATQTGGTIGLEFDASGITLKGLRFAAFVTGGDVCIATTAAGVYCRVLECNFAVGTDTDIDDALSAAGKKVIAVANLVEV